MTSAEAALPRATGLDRLIGLRFSWRAGALVVRPPLLGYLWSAVGVTIGLGIIANGLWGRTGDPGQVAFGASYALIGGWFAFVTSRPWVSADPVGLRVGVVRRMRVPWEDLTGVMVRDASARGIWPVTLRIERRAGRTLQLLPVLTIRSYDRIAELRYVAKRLAIEAERHGHGPIRWPEHLTYRDRSGTTHTVR